MKLGLKIVLPTLLLFIVILGAFGYLIVNLKRQEAVIITQGAKVQKLSSLNERLTWQQEQTDYNVLSYRFNPDKSFLSAISQAELDKSKTLDEMYPFITSEKGRELVNIYIEARKEVESLRSKLIEAISEGDQEQINLFYNKWNIQTQNIKVALTDIKAHNINSLEQTLAAVGDIGSKIIQTVIILIFVVIVTILFLYFYLRNVIIIPIIKLAQFANEVTNNNFGVATTDITTARADELGVLFRAFSTMVVKLKESYETLEQKIVERTSSLMEKTREMKDSQRAMLNVLEDSREVEANLQIERDKSNTIISSMGEGLLVIDYEFKISLINPTAEKLFGLKHGEAVGKDIRKFFTVIQNGEVLDEEDRPITRTILNNESVITKLEDNMLLRVELSGKSFPVAQATTPIVVGDIRGAVVVFRDITEEKLLDDAKASFISIASHQLRTPLTSVRWYSEILLDEEAGKLNNDQKEFARQVHEGALRLFRTIDTLLAISRLESGKSQGEVVETDLRSFSENIVKDMGALTKDRNLDLSIDFPDNIPKVVIGNFMLREVVTNLIANSIRYTHKGGKIQLGFKYDGREITGLVFDNGIGIPEEDKDKIFSKFYRASNAVEKVPDGSGLGLSLVKGFVEKWGGKIWFESVVDEGTTFYFTIPEECVLKSKK